MLPELGNLGSATFRRRAELAWLRYLDDTSGDQDLRPDDGQDHGFRELLDVLEEVERPWPEGLR